MKVSEIKNEADTNEPAVMYLFGTIGDDLQCGDFVRQLNELAETNSTIVIHINSGGGSVFDGLAMYNALVKCKAVTIGKIDGICASMATVVALGMNKLYMCTSAQFMTHKASGGAYGSSDDLKTYASMMDNLEKVICDVYAKKTGLSAEEVGKTFLQAQDRWFSATQALEAKLIDGIYESDGDTIAVPATMKEQKELIAFYNNHFKNFSSHMKQIIMSAGQLASLGCKPESDPAVVTAAFDAMISRAARADQLEKDVVKLTNDLSAERSKGVIAKVESLLDKALNTDKKITAEAAASLKADYKENPEGLEKLLNSLPKIMSVTDHLKEGEQTGDFKGTWPELDKAGKLQSLKEKDLPLFKAKYRAHFGKDYAGQ